MTIIPSSAHAFTPSRAWGCWRWPAYWRRLGAVEPPADTLDPLELDRLLLRVAGRAVRHDYALLPAAVWPAGAVRGLGADPDCRLQIANCKLGAKTIFNIQFAIYNSLG